MYVIWNKHSWNAYDRTPAWVPYTGANPHTDHIHISLSWDGALKRTSFWTGTATTRLRLRPLPGLDRRAGRAGPALRALRDARATARARPSRAAGTPTPPPT